MESRQVRHFLAAYDAGTFVAAAEQLGLSQQAVSKSILRLEAQLGVRLFERDGRRVRPTAYAELFLPHARTIAAETDRFRADLGDMLGGRHGRLRIGVGPSAAADVVASAVKMITTERPNVRLSVLAGIYEMMVADLLLGKLDVVVAVRQVDRNDPLIREEPLGDIRYVVLAGANHPLAGRGRLTLADLKGARWLAGANIGAVEQAIEASFRAAGLPRPRPEIETTSVIFTLAMLDAGMHLAILPEMLVARDLEMRRLVRIDIDAEPWTRPLIVATRVRAPKPPIVDAFMASLVEAMR
ncbi:LysR family transcriptional regulator [Sphingomonas sp. LaA6.9]|uniref:LysR family transcriptional regulator n=1 Tax=Sphingomonas sp. LaA6.9 TaxID=2919914 RepID=UPI001F4F2646|nr:LysR family transcriptional regulator [Sphingomonas sp. LaA6.9]MCJ8155984.1 LysR family transcriptional regulator [Sphingomonas sp. LaA6.9]